MSTLVSRSLSASATKDKLAIKAQSQTYKDKWGVFKLTITSYQANAGAGVVDIRPAQYNPDNDSIIVDEAAVSDTSLHYVLKDYFFSVNNGVPGPSVKVQEDGTWDLVHFSLTRTSGTIQVTVTYTLAFTDLTPVSNPGDTGTLTLSVDNVRLTDNAFVTSAASTFTDKQGYVVAQLNDLHTTVIDEPDDVTDPVAGDSVPMFSVINDITPGGSGSTTPLVAHSTTKVSGDKTYDKTLLVFAVNSGQIDANARNVKATTDFKSFLETKLDKLSDYPCDDEVTCIVDYALTFTEVTTTTTP